ncbi:MAG: chain-length determining protein, partial [Alphaproteobacteria bacterium]|nr:chain-length determining protein [Alphaproteobacteria bacterium]
LFVGLAAGAGTAFVLGQLKSAFTTADRLERALDLPVVGTISRSMTKAREAHARKRFKQFAAGTGALGGVCILLLAVEFIQVGTVA